MLNITDDVKQILKDGIEEYCGDGIHFRLIPPSEGKVALMLNARKADDVIFEDGDAILLLMGRNLASSLKYKTLCVKETETGPTLVIVAIPGSGCVIAWVSPNRPPISCGKLISDESY